MKREIDYQWRLSELMARRGLHNSTDLAPLLRERGSTSPPHRSTGSSPSAQNASLSRSLPRCQRPTGKIRVHWPDGAICGI